MPLQYGIGLHDEQCVSPTGEAPTRQNPESPILIVQARALLLALQDHQLLSETEILGDQQHSGFKAASSPRIIHRNTIAPLLIESRAAFQRLRDEPSRPDHVFAPFNDASHVPAIDAEDLRRSAFVAPNALRQSRWGR
jgi:hypothetical protein